MIEHMRTTLTLEDDVAAMLKRLRRERKLRLKEAVNLALREGLVKLSHPPLPRGAPYRTRAVSLGRCLLGSLDNVAEALAAAEGEGFK